MTDNHPITPPLALIDQWWDEAKQNAKYDEPIGPLVATQAAQWGADQELKACLDEIYKGVGLRVIDHGSHRELLCSDLRAARRPKPPSLKEQALEALEHILHNSSTELGAETIRRALEQLND